MKTNKLVYGKGMNDLDEPIYKNGKILKFYDTWHSMINRCYSDKLHVRSPSYIGCSVCPEWLSLSTFRIWFNANYRDGMEMDKDILIPGNKMYCPEACRFVPHYINSLLTNAGAIRGELPLGVTAIKTKLKNGQITTTYMALCNDGHNKSLRKNFRTIPEARQWYITTKTRIVAYQAIRAFNAGEITGDVYQALITREW